MERDAYSIHEFCERHCLSRASFYNLQKIGKAPRVLRVGQKVLVSREAAEQWRRDREAESSAKTERHVEGVA
jgi:hypothetical protein